MTCALALVACQAVTQRQATKMDFSRDDFSSLRKDAKDTPEKSRKDRSPTKDAEAGDLVKAELEMAPATEKWEFGAVKDVILQLTKEAPDVRHMKVCYSAEDDEWWITLYQLKGAAYDLKTNIWSRNHDRPEPFLLKKTIDRRNLERHLAAKDDETRCMAFEFTDKGWVAWQQETASKALAKPAETDDTGSRKKTAKSVGESRPLDSKLEKKSKVSERRSGPTSRSQPKAPAKQTGPGVRDSRPKSQDHPYFRQAVAGPSPSPNADRDRESHIERPAPRYTPQKQGHEKTFSRRHGWQEVPGREDRKRVDPRKSIEDRKVRIRESHDRMTVVSDVRPQESTERITDVKRKPEPAAPEEAETRKKKVPTCLVFAYGSKMNHPHLLKALKAAGHDSSLVIDAFPAELKGYGVAWNYYSRDRGAGTINLEPKAHASVYGLAMEIDDSLLPVWDRIQGHPSYYNRGARRLKIRRLKDGKTFFAWVYRAKPAPSGRRDFRPTREYQQGILQAANFWGLPSKYVNEIKTWPTK